MFAVADKSARAFVGLLVLRSRILIGTRMAVGIRICKKSTHRKGGETTVSTVTTDSGTATALANQNLAEHAAC